MMKGIFYAAVIGAVLSLGMAVQVDAAVQYSNDFDNATSTNVTESWPEWVMDSSDGFCEAVNGRIEWDSSGGNNDWLRLNMPVPKNYVYEFDLFLQEDRNGRFSVWPFCNEGDTYTRYNYFVRKNTHYYNGADTVPSEGSFDATLPLGANPHRMRVEVTGNSVLFLYKKNGVGGWILIDKHDFPAIEEPRYIMLGHNSDDGVDGLWYVDNFVLSYSSQDLMSYSNNFDNAASTNVTESWPEWVMDSSAGFCEAVNGRIEWDSSGGNNDWLRLNMEVPENYVYEFDLFLQEDRNGRFSVWPFCNEGDTYTRYNYFVRKNTHYYNGADTVPSEGSFDATLPLGADPHRMRVEVTGDHVLFLYKKNGEGGWILIDEHDFPTIESPRYVMLGHNSDDGVDGLWYIDNFVLNELASDRATVARSIGATEFTANTPVPVSLAVTAVGSVPSLTITEVIPEYWSATNISNGGVFIDGTIYWSFLNLSESVTLTYDAVPPRLTQNQDGVFSGSVDSGEGEERIGGDTEISLDLPYLYRECIDYDFSGSPVDGKNYPTGTEYGVRYCQDMLGVPANTPYTRPGGGSTPAIDAVFEFEAGADFYFANPEIPRGGDTNYHLAGYRDDGLISLEKGSSDTGVGIGGDRISAGDWFRYTFDFGEGDQVILVNLSVNMWGNSQNLDCPIDMYIDNQFKGFFLPVYTGYNAYEFVTLGPIEITGGVHSIVLAVPGPNLPDSLGRMEIVRVSGIGHVNRTLTSDGFFDSDQPLTVTLTATADYGSYTALIDEYLPSGVTVTDISDGGTQVDGVIQFTLDPTTSSQSITYTLASSEGSRYLLFDGLCDTGLPLAEPVRGDVSVTNEVWLFGTPTEESTDNFDDAEVADPWFVEYGSDPALSTNYEEGVD
ncbi:MAG: Ig-like domain-containing protein, partial [Candidatus Hinthialibacter sp.]